MIQFVTGNLLDAKVDALVNTVNTVGVMGKGLALQFKAAYPANNKAYEAACKRGEVQIGKMFVFDVGGLVSPRYIINFPTKRHWRSPSQLAYVELGLAALASVIRERKIRSIAVPPLGAGLGGLAWPKVRNLIQRILEPLTATEVLVFEPHDLPPAQRLRPVTTPKPQMTPGRAAVLTLMHRYQVPGYPYRLSLLEVQKLAYFLQVAGEPLRLNYQPHYYGPYADNLQHVLAHIEGHYIRGYGDGSNKPTTSLELIHGVADEAEGFIAANAASHTRIERVATLIEGYETPLGMELLASVHWVATHNDDAARSCDAAVSTIHAWNPRKARLMKPGYVRTAWNHLQTQGWI